MDSIVKLLLALIIGYCFVKLFCGCSVEGISEKIKEEGEQLLEELEEEIQEKYNPTPTPASNNAQQLGSIFGGCEKGQYMHGAFACDDCPVGKYNDKGGYFDDCKSCPSGSVPITDNRSMGQPKSTNCMFCGKTNSGFHEGNSNTSPQLGVDQIGQRYSDGSRCQDCPDNSSVNRKAIKGITSSWIDPWLGVEVTVALEGGRSINDCICNEGYIKATNEGGGWTCTKCETGFPNKPPEENPDKCVELGSVDCPKIKFNGQACNTQPCEDGQTPVLVNDTVECYKYDEE